MVPLLLLAACDPEPPPCVNVAPYADAELHNHALPFEVALDPARRRAYVSALATATVAVVDLDAAAVTDVLVLGGDALVTPDLVVDGLGWLWVLSSGERPLIRVDPDDGERDEPWVAFSQAKAALPRPTGGLLLLAGDGAGDASLWRLDANGTPLGLASVGPATGLVAVDDTRVGVLAIDTMTVLDRETLEIVGTCALPFAAVRGAALPDGTVVVADDTRVGLAGCDGAMAVAWDVGTENKDVVVWGDGALILDRIGDDTRGDDPNLGVVHAADGDGVEVARWVSGKNTGFGAIDPETGWMWGNSEGTNELLAWDPDSGEPRAAVRLGAFVDGVAIDPDGGGVAYATGRVADTVVRIDGEALSALTLEVHWPYSPVPDVTRDVVWVLDQTRTVAYGLDRADLSVRRVLDPGLGANKTLTFSTLVVHPRDGDLYVAHAPSDTLVRLDPDSGAELQRWALGGAYTDDPDQVGELSVRVDGPDGSVFVARSHDGRLQRIVPGDDAIATTYGAPPDDGAYDIDFARVFPDLGRVWLWGLAFDATTLARVPEDDRDVSRMLGPFPGKGGHALAIDSDRREIVHLGRDGGVRGRTGFAARDLSAMAVRIDPDLRRVAFTRSADAFVCLWDVADVR